MQLCLFYCRQLISVVILRWHTCVLRNGCHWHTSAAFTLAVMAQLSRTIRCVWPLTDVLKLTSTCVLCIWVNATVLLCFVWLQVCIHLSLELVINGTSHNWWPVKSDKQWGRYVCLIKPVCFLHQVSLTIWEPTHTVKVEAVLFSQWQWLDLKYFVQHLCRSEGYFYHMCGSHCDSISII